MTQTGYYNIDPSTMFTVTEAAEMLGLSEHTVYRHIWSGRIPARKMLNYWLIRKRDVDNELAMREIIERSKSK